MASLEAALLPALAKLEAARAELHESLRVAGFQLSCTRHVEEQRGRLIAFDAVPADAGTLAPSQFTQWAEEAAEGGGRWVLVAAADTEDTKTHADSDAGAVGLRDPLRYFSAAPSEELRECQQRYKEVLQHAVAVANAQAEAMQAAHPH